ncbi:hypothetical protein [Crystallibacter crystallopoietes]|nr:hypothetical protein [Arthrobacter crystallopoietes]
MGWLRKPHSKTLAKQGRRTVGLVTAIKPQTHFDRERNNIRIPVRAEYVDPYTGRKVNGVFTLDRYTANIPSCIAAPVGVNTFTSRRKIASEDLFARNHVSSSADEEGFRALLNPVPVDVRVVRRGSGGTRIHIVFRP